MIFKDQATLVITDAEMALSDIFGKIEERFLIILIAPDHEFVPWVKT